MISIPSQVQANFQQSADDILNNITGRTCTLYYPPLQVPCPALVQQGDIAESFWITGDPQYVHSQQLCPLCNGTSFIMQEQKDTVIMAIYWKPGQFSKDFPADHRHEEGVIQTKGFATIESAAVKIGQIDLLKVMNCARMESFNELGTDHYNFKLLGEPIVPGKIARNRYFYCLWKRV